jgi:hypothetical protein
MWLKIGSKHLLLLSLQWVVDGPTSNNLKRILMDAMVLYGGLI